MSLRTTEMEYGEQQVVAVRLANLQTLCQQNGVKTLPEKVIRDCIEKFDLGELRKKYNKVRRYKEGQI